MTCPCINIGAVSHDEALSSLIELRSECPALSKILLPNEMWDEYLARAREPHDEAHHCPLVLGLLEMGRLSVLTKQVHKHLLLDGEISPKLDSNYKRDLQDTWFLETEGAMRRHTVFKRGSGKLYELISLDWFEDNGYTVTDLAAVGGQADIELVKDEGKYLVEMKYIGMDDRFFDSICRNLNGEPSGYSSSPDDAVNFVLSRIYEAAVQLSKLPTGTGNESKIASIVLDPFTWQGPGEDIVRGWIDWDDPKFSETGPGSEWDEYMKKLEERYLNIREDVKDVIQDNCDEIWLFKEHPYTVLARERVVTF